MDPSLRRLKNGASRRQLLMASSTNDGPWCAVRFVKTIEVCGASADTTIKIEVRDELRNDEPPAYTHKGNGHKAVNIPRGEVKITRLKGKEPITVYAHSGP
jgi:hypothetical protein